MNSRLNHAKNKPKELKRNIAEELLNRRLEMQATLEKLISDDIITVVEKESLEECMDNIDEYHLKKDDYIREEVKSMGDEGYVALSDRLRAQFKEEYREVGREEGRAEGRAEGENRAFDLIKLLLDAGRYEDIKKVTENQDYKVKLMKEFNLF